MLWDACARRLCEIVALSETGLCACRGKMQDLLVD